VSSLFLPPNITTPAPNVDSCPVRCNFLLAAKFASILTTAFEGQLKLRQPIRIAHSQPPLRYYSHAKYWKLKYPISDFCGGTALTWLLFCEKRIDLAKAPGPSIYFNQGPVTCSLNSIGANEDFESVKWSIIRTFIISYCCGRCYILGEAQLHRLWCGYNPFWRGSTNLSVYAQPVFSSQIKHQQRRELPYANTSLIDYYLT